MSSQDSKKDQPQAAAGSVPAFSFPFSPEAFAPQNNDNTPHDPSGKKGDRHHQGRIYHRRGSHRVLGKR